MIQKIHFTSEGEEIKGTLVTPATLQKKNPAVIFFHGMTSSEKNYIPIAEKLAKEGIVGLTLSIRGHGASEGNFKKLTVNNAIADGLNTYDFFSHYDFVDPERIGLCGASLGAAIVAMVSAKRNVKSLLLRVPATYTDDMMTMTYEQIMITEDKIFQNITTAIDTPPIQAITQYEGKLLLITSENDHVIPEFIPEEFLDNAKKAKRKEKIMIKEATHNLAEDRWRNQFVKQTVKWFTQTL